MNSDVTSRNRGLRPAAIAIAILLSVFPASAGTNDWTIDGLPGGTIRGVALSPSRPGRAFAVADIGLEQIRLVRSTDDGASWQPLRTGLDEIEGVAGAPSSPAAGVWLEVAATDADVVFVGRTGASGALAVSTDAGATWRSCPAEFPSGPASAFALDPRSPGSIHAAAGDHLFHSTDFGVSWTAQGIGLPPGAAIRDISVSGASPGSVWVCGAGISISTDGGATFRTSTPPLDFRRVAVSPLDSRVGIGWEPALGRIWRTVDGGESWSDDAAIDHPVGDLAFDAGVRDRVFLATGDLGLLVSEDAGLSFRASNTGLGKSGQTPAALSLALRPGIVMVGLDFEGLFSSTDGALGWAPRNGDLNLRPADRLSTGLPPLGGLFALGQGALFRRASEGSWIELSTPLPAIRAFDASPRDGRILFASAGDALHRSADGGETWTAIERPSDSDLAAIAIDPFDPRVVFVGSGEAPGKVHRSTDSGTTWTDVTGDITGFGIHSITPDRFVPGRLLLASASDGYGYSGGIFVSSDRAATWRRTFSLWSRDSSPLAQHPADPATIAGIRRTGYPVPSLSLVLSTDGGESWRIPEVPQYSCTACMTGPGAVAMHPTDPAKSGLGYSIAYSSFGAVWTNLGIRLTEDSGTSWRDASTPEVAVLPISSLAWDPADGRTLFAAGKDRLVSLTEKATVVRNVSPATGPIDGGSIVEISGEGFADRARVFFGSIEARVLAISGDTTLTVETPPHPAGLADVIVINPEGSRGAIPEGFAYFAACPSPPTAVSPADFGICLGSEGSIEIALSGTPPWTLEWNDGFVQSAIAESPVVRAVRPITSTSYFVTRVSDSSCSNIGAGHTDIAVHPVPSSPLIDAPALARQGERGLVASVSESGIVPGVVSWTIENGEISGPTTGTAIRFRAGQAGVTRLTATTTSSEGCASPASTFAISVSPTNDEWVVPLIADLWGRAGRWTTELVLANRSQAPVDLRLDYRAASGAGASGSGTVVVPLRAGEQRLIPDALSFLRSLGLAIPESTASQPQAGTLRIRAFDLPEPRVTWGGARISSETSRGRHGVFFAGLEPESERRARRVIAGLRESSSETTNLALVNLSETEPATFRVTLVEGDSPGRREVLPELVVPPAEWRQLHRPLLPFGFRTAWAHVERLGPEVPFTTWATVNDSISGDSVAFFGQSELEVQKIGFPVVTEGPVFTTEISVANPTPDEARVDLVYWESAAPDFPTPTSIHFDLEPDRQRTIPSLLQEFRNQGQAVAPPGRVLAGLLRVDGGHNQFKTDLASSVRILAESPEGGFESCSVPPTEIAAAAREEAWLFGLRQDGRVRTNLGIVNAEPGLRAPQTFVVDLFDGETGALAASLGPLEIGGGRWVQLGQPLAASNVRHGYARIRRVTGALGARGLVAYASLVDGPAPGVGTDDASWVPMVTAE